VPENGCEVVVVGASAGGVEALTRFVRALPADFDTPILVVLHVPSTWPSLLPDILNRAGPLPATHAVDGEILLGGRIYVAPPDCHLQVTGNHIELTKSARENGHRPAIDPLFRTAAAAYDGATAGVILSGTLDDGTVGLSQIKLKHGATLVQDPEDAIYPAMPVNAIDFVEPDYVLPVEALVETLVRLTATGTGRAGKEVTVEPAPDPSLEDAQAGEVAPFSCPDCGGTLWETVTDGVPSYRCRVGHAFTANTLAARHSDTVERAFWTAYRALEEQAAMSRRLARRLADRGRHESAERFSRRAEVSARHARELKTLLDLLEPTPDVGAANAAPAKAQS
jgi:two-component system, chemotaxis family, protein-glutamate methylesterase/glutaminase